MADVDLTITIPDAWTTKVIDAFTQSSGADTRIRIEIDNIQIDPSDGFHTSWMFTIAEKGGSETLVEFGERFLREIGKAIVDAIDIKEDEERYEDEIALIDPPSSDVSGDIFT